MQYMLDIVTQYGRTIDYDCSGTLLDAVKFVQSYNILIWHVIACDLSMWYDRCNNRGSQHFDSDHDGIMNSLLLLFL